MTLYHIGVRSRVSVYPNAVLLCMYSGVVWTTLEEPYIKYPANSHHQLNSRVDIQSLSIDNGANSWFSGLLSCCGQRSRIWCREPDSARLSTSSMFLQIPLLLVKNLTTFSVSDFPQSLDLCFTTPTVTISQSGTRSNRKSTQPVASSLPVPLMFLRSCPF